MITRILFSIGLGLVVIFLPQASSALTIAPAIIDAKLDPGASRTYQIHLYNETKEDLFIDGSIEKFTPKGERGEAQIKPLEIADQAAKWLQLPDNSLVLKAGAEITVPLIITIPQTAEVGGYYLALMWQSSAGPKSNKSSQTLVASRVGALVLLEVAGAVNNNLELVDFYLTNPAKVYASLPTDFTLRLRNSGSVHQRPQGSVIIKNFLGQTVAALPFNEKLGAILPSTTRIFTTEEKNQAENFLSVLTGQLTHLAFGRFSAQALITYGADQNLDSNIIYFWVLPWPVLIFILALIVVMIFLTTVFKRQNKK